MRFRGNWESDVKLWVRHPQKAHPCVEPRQNFDVFCNKVGVGVSAVGHWNTHTHTRLTALCLGLPRSVGTRKVKPIWTLLEQETVSGSGISWAICKSAPRSRQTTTPAPHHSVFYTPDALPATQPTASKHWRQYKALKATGRTQKM